MFQKNIVKKNEGITLIALVITIIILLILSGVVLNIAINNGLFDKAKLAGKQTEIESVKEKLEMEKGDLAVENAGDLNIKKYLDKIKEKGLTSEDDILENNENSYDVTTEGYVFLVEKENDGDIKIEYLEEVGNSKPVIDVQVISSTSNSITIKYNIKNANKYKLSIKKEDEENYKSLKEKEVEEKEIEEVIEELEQGQRYK